MDRIRIAIIGLGTMGMKHFQSYKNMADAEIVAVVDFNEARAKQVSEENGNIPYFTSYEEMLAQIKPEAVAIAVPDAAHVEPVEASLKAGAHVLIEKPLATKLSDSDYLIDLAKKQNRILMVNYTHRWVPAYYNAKVELRKGKMGQVAMVYAKKNDPIYVVRNWPWLKDSSPAAFLSSHDIDLVRWFIGCEAVSVYARGHKGVLKKEYNIDTWDCIQASVEFENGAIAVFESCFIYPEKFPTYTDSFIQLTMEHGVIRMPRMIEGFEMATDEAFEYPKLGISYDYDGDIQGAFVMASRHFIHCIKTGEEPETTGWQARQVSEIVEGIHRSLETGEVIKLPIKE